MRSLRRPSLLLAVAATLTPASPWLWTAIAFSPPSRYPRDFVSIRRRYDDSDNDDRPRRRSRGGGERSIASATAAATLRMAVRYGPRDDDDVRLPTDAEIERRERLTYEFRTMLRTVAEGTTPEEEVPSLLARNFDAIMEVIGTSAGEGDGCEDGRSLLEEIAREEAENGGDGGLDRVSDAIDLILAFAESFAEEARSADEAHKRLLGTIFQTIAPETDGDKLSPSAMEERLDELLSAEREAFTPGFLRHVEGECERIANLKTTSPESARMTQVLRLIQARVLEELGKGIGEGAVVLGQLLGYDDDSERAAVLDAGLAVRGVDFAKELAALTAEALKGFGEVRTQGGEVDPELVRSVEGIDDRIRRFIERNEEKDFQ